MRIHPTLDTTVNKYDCSLAFMRDQEYKPTIKTFKPFNSKNVENRTEDAARQLITACLDSAESKYYIEARHSDAAYITLFKFFIFFFHFAVP